MEERNYMDMLIPPIGNLKELCDELHKIFSEDRVNVDYLKGVLSAYKSCPADFKKFANFDRHRYTRNLVDDGNGKFNLLALCWNEGQGSSIHSHADSHCFVKVLDGSLMETMFAWPEEDDVPLGQTACNVYHKDQVTYINDSMGLHRMENASNADTCITLHLYSPPFELVDTFDQNTGHKRTVKVTFTTKYGQKVNPAENGTCARPDGQHTSDVTCYGDNAENN